MTKEEMSVPDVRALCAEIEQLLQWGPSRVNAKQLHDTLTSAAVVLRRFESDAIDDIVTERRRQVEGEGCSDAHDDTLERGEIAIAAAGYATPPEFRTDPPVLWKYAACAWKPASRRRELVKAGALIVAEIERLDRQ
jgi:hypothetical protein